MNRKTTLAGIFTACIFMLAFGTASATVVGSEHDFSTGGGSAFQSTNETEVCIFCHTPHNGVSADTPGNRVPLWNKNLSESATYTMYTSSTFDGDDVAYPQGYYNGNKPTGISLLCLSCHDGVATSTINTVRNTGPNGAINMPANQDAIADLAGFYPPYLNPNIGLDLSNDHPVSFRYDDALVSADTASRGNVPGLNDPGTIDSRLKLFSGDATGGRLECATCHDPHENGMLTNRFPFLRMNNNGSVMCTSCHIK